MTQYIFLVKKEQFSIFSPCWFRVCCKQIGSNWMLTHPMMLDLSVGWIELELDSLYVAFSYQFQTPSYFLILIEFYFM